MSRTKKDPELMRSMCGRLRYLSQDILGLSDRDIALRMGYSNATTLWRVWQGKTFPDAEKLYRLAELQAPDGGHPSLHWVITGDGLPTVQEKDSVGIADDREMLRDRILVLPMKKVRSLLALLSD